MSPILFQFPEIPNVYCLFSGRKFPDALMGNISWNVGEEGVTRQSRKELYEFASKYGLKGIAECKQVHGIGIIEDPSFIEYMYKSCGLLEADGMMSSRPDIGLMIKTADCQPILLTDRKGCHIMALHVGWRGNRSSFPIIAVNSFCKKYNIDPEDLYAVRGPSLGPNHAEFINFDKEWGEEFKKWFNPKTKCMDLWKLTRDQLIKAGLCKDNIFEIPVCTYDNHHAWFSHRRDNHTGRQASIVWISNSALKGSE